MAIYDFDPLTHSWRRRMSPVELLRARLGHAAETCLYLLTLAGSLAAVVLLILN